MMWGTTLAVGDVVYNTMIGGVVTIVLAYMQWKNTKAVKESSQTAHAGTEDVKQRLEANTKNVDAKLDTIHGLVNNGMTIQLRLTATALRALADNTGNPEHARNAEAAEQLLAEHVRQQAAVDAEAAKGKQHGGG